MPPVAFPLPVLRTCALRPRSAFTAPRTSKVVFAAKQTATRHYADDKSQSAQAVDPLQTGPDVQPEDHVSEEAAKIAKIQGKEGPDLEQGTPVQEILKNDKKARDQAPQVVKESIKAGTPSPSPSTSTSKTRSFSTYARRRAEEMSSTGAYSSELHPSMIPPTEQRADYRLSPLTNTEVANQAKPGHKFPLPDLPLPPRSHKDHRYDPLCTQVIGLLMRDGKKAAAQRHLSLVLDILRTSPAPKYSDARPLLPGVPPASHLPLNPIIYLTVAIDSIAPLLRIRSQRGAAGGGVALQIPVPLNLRQRRRTAISWILDAASKRKSSGSGNKQLAARIASEIISIVEGRSPIWDKRLATHRLGTAARTNINWARGSR